MDSPDSSRRFRQLALMAVVTAVLSLVYFQSTSSPKTEELAYSTFVTAVDQGGIRSVTIEGQNVVAQRTSGGTVATYAPQGADLMAQLQRHGIEINAAPPAQPSLLLSLLFSLLPFALMIGISIWIARKSMGNPDGGMLSIGKSKARLVKPAVPVTF